MSKLVINDREIEIPSLKVKHLESVLKYGFPIVQQINEKGMVQALADNVENLIMLVVSLGIVDRDWLEEQEPVALLEILRALLETNADFFIQAGTVTNAKAE